MLNQVALLSLLMFLCLLVACNRPAISQTSDPVEKASPSPTERAPVPEQLIDIFLDEDTLLHHGFEVRRLKKTIDYEYPIEDGKRRSIPIEISYAVVKRNGKLLAEFDGPYFGHGNITDFGLFDLLGDGSQQVIISTTVFRGGRHWVVSLHREFRVLFDSGNSREEFSVIDLDKDGIYEISLPVTAFYSMPDLMYTGEIPLPEIIYKYDADKKVYLPANALYLDYSLGGIDDEIRSLDEKDRYFSKRLRILLRYIYAGKEADGWAFFDSAYQHPDKQKMKSRIQSVLNNEPVYKYLQQSK